MSTSKINFPVIIILMTVLLDSMGIGIMIPVMPELFKSVLPNSTTADASVWAGALASIFALMQFLFGPLLGTLSDRVGRKPVILISLILMVGYYLIMAVAQTVWLLLIGRIVANAVFFIPWIDGAWFRVFVGTVLLAAVFANERIRKRITGGI